MLKREDVSTYKRLPQNEVDESGTSRTKRSSESRYPLTVLKKQQNVLTSRRQLCGQKRRTTNTILCTRRELKKNSPKWLRIEELANGTYCGVKGVAQILVEDRGAGTQYIQVRKTSPSRSLSSPLLPSSNRNRSASTGSHQCSPLGRVLLPEKGVDWIADVEAELYAFPAGRNDDYVDTVSQYLAYARGNNIQRGNRKLITY